MTLLSYVLGLVWAALLGLTPFGARLVSRCGRRWWLQAFLGTLALQALLELEALPADVRVEQLLRRAGVSTATWGQWAQVVATSWASSALVTAALLTALVGLARRFPRRWWAGLGAVGAAFVVVVSFAYPVVVLPLTSTVRTFPAGSQKDVLDAVARVDGPTEPLAVSSALAPSTAENALTVGFGPTSQVVYYDTVVAQATPAQLASIQGHEMGHVRNHDVLRGTLEGAVALGAVACLAPVLLGSAWSRRRSGSDGPGDPRVVGLVLAWVVLLGAAAGPVQAAVSRRIEARADEHALAVTHDPVAFQQVEVQLTLASLSDPDPPGWLQDLFGDHPTSVQRLGYASR